MKMTLKGNNLEMTDAIKSYAEKKLGVLDKFISEGTKADIHVELQRTTEHHKKGDVFEATANIVLPGKVLRAEALNTNLYAAMDELKDELTRELKKYKGRHQDLRRRGLRSLKKRLRLSRFAWKKEDINDKNL